MSWDVCIYGEAAGGLIAAVAAARAGRSAVLVSPRRRLGGLTSGGLGATDAGNVHVIGGIAREVYHRIGRAYGVPERFTFEPHVAEAVFRELADEAGVAVIFDARLVGVEKRGARVTELRLANGGRVAARAFVDASYEGDLMARAGVAHTVGREPVSAHGESLNGIRGATPHHQFDIRVDPYVRPGDPASGFLPLIQPGDGGVPGEGDGKVQAYNYRLCLTRDPANRIPIAPSRGYTPWRYEVLGRLCAARRAAGIPVRFSDFFLVVTMPNGKTDFNNRGAVSTDHLGANWDYPEADWGRRAEIWRDHEAYMRGLFHFLATDERVPAVVRAEARSWGLCRDEFAATGGWSPQLYVREARRMLGRYVVTQTDCEGKTAVEDAVGMGAYTMDSHNIQRVVREGAAVNEGDVQIGVSPYPISYRAITPREDQAENLLVTTCLSATHIAYGSIRMEPVFMVLGQAAGLALDAALGERKPVQGIDVTALRTRLRQGGVVLSYDPAAAKPSGGWLHDAQVYVSEEAG